MIYLAEAGLNVSVGAEHVLNLGPLQVNNSMLLGTVGWILTFWLLVRTVRRVRAKRYDRLTVAVFWAYQYLLDTTVEVLGDRERAIKLAPLAITMFFFILVNNWLEILPILGPVTYNGVQMFRGLSADMNFTFALAVITFATAHIWAIRDRGFFGNLGRYFHNPFKDPVHGLRRFFRDCGGDFAVFGAVATVVWKHLRRGGTTAGGGVYYLICVNNRATALPAV